MAGVRSIVARILGMFRRQELDDRVDEELQFHIEMQTEENVRRGMSPREARRQALLRCGGVEQVKEEHRDARTVRFLSSLGRDLRFALRTYRRRPGVTATAVVTLALGIGVSTVLFSGPNQILMEPLPLREPNRLAILVSRIEAIGREWASVSPFSFTRWRDQNHSFEDLAAISESQAAQFTSGDVPFSGHFRGATANFFRLLGLQPILGRGLQPDDERLDAPLVVVMSRRVWITRFGADPDIVGKQLRILTLNGRNSFLVQDTRLYTVVGVMPDPPPNVVPGEGYDVWGPWRDDADSKIRYLQVYGRLRTGVELEQARSEMVAIDARIPEDHDEGFSVNVFSLADNALGPVRPGLIILSAAAGLLLLAACANIATLLLGQVKRRSAEFGVRASLGAGRARVMRQLVTENFLMSLIGGMVGCLVAWALLRTLATLGMEQWLSGWEIRLSPVSLLFAFAVCCIATLLFGLAPMIAASRRDIRQSIGAGGVDLSGTRGKSLNQGLLVAVQTALALILVIGAVLFFRASLNTMEELNRGMNLEQVYVIPIDLPWLYNGDQAHSVFREVLERTESLAGVSSAALAQSVPGVAEWRSSVHRKPPAPGERLERNPTARDNVSAGYFQTVGVRLLRGRLLGKQDWGRRPVPVLINEAMERRDWDGQDPIGTYAYIGKAEFEVVGIVSDATNSALAGAMPEIYFHYSEQGLTSTNLLVRYTGSGENLAAAIREVIHSVDATIPVEQVIPAAQRFKEQLAPRTLITTLMVVFACFTLVLAAVGIWGVVANAVASRTREIGLRLALGAGPRQVIAESMRRGLGWSLVGVVVGALGSFGLARSAANQLWGNSPYQLWGVSATDPLAFAGVPFVLLLVTLAAAYLPARRAAKVDPAVALRCE